jgi:hypothetical protein
MYAVSPLNIPSPLPHLLPLPTPPPPIPILVPLMKKSLYVYSRESVKDCPRRVKINSMASGTVVISYMGPLGGKQGF